MGYRSWCKVNAVDASQPRGTGWSALACSGVAMSFCSGTGFLLHFVPTQTPSKLFKGFSPLVLSFFLASSMT